MQQPAMATHDFSDALFNYVNDRWNSVKLFARPSSKGRTRCRAVAEHTGKLCLFKLKPEDAATRREKWTWLAKQSDFTTDEFYAELKEYIRLSHCSQSHRECRVHEQALSDLIEQWKAKLVTEENEAAKAVEDEYVVESTPEEVDSTLEDSEPDDSLSIASSYISDGFDESGVELDALTPDSTLNDGDVFQENSDTIASAKNAEDDANLEPPDEMPAAEEDGVADGEEEGEKSSTENANTETRLDELSAKSNELTASDEPGEITQCEDSFSVAPEVAMSLPTPTVEGNIDSSDEASPRKDELGSDAEDEKTKSLAADSNGQASASDGQDSSYCSVDPENETQDDDDEPLSQIPTIFDDMESTVVGSTDDKLDSGKKSKSRKVGRTMAKVEVFARKMVQRASDQISQVKEGYNEYHQEKKWEAPKANGTTD